VSAYVVYDKSTLAIVKQGVADDCAAQIDNVETQDVATADNADDLEAQKAELGLH
jgi:hypothetical protein